MIGNIANDWKYCVNVQIFYFALPSRLSSVGKEKILNLTIPIIIHYQFICQLSLEKIYTCIYN